MRSALNNKFFRQKIAEKLDRFLSLHFIILIIVIYTFFI